MSAIDAASVLARFESAEPFTVGLEEELMLLDPASGDLAPRAPEALALLDRDPRFKLELPAAQLEIMTGPHHRVGDAIDELRAGRSRLSESLEGIFDLAAAGVHPTAAPEGELNPGDRYERTASEFGLIARRQLVFALQVHVAPGGGDHALAVYNALRSYLPEIAALAANAPFYAGSDTGLASVRPKIGELLPRQGVPPPLASWEQYVAELDWGLRCGALHSPASWWWELRPSRFGTLELRVPDAQTTLAEAAAVAGFIQSLVAWLAGRVDAGDELRPDPTWRIEQNRWLAARDGVEGELADLQSGERRKTRERLGQLIDELSPPASRLGCSGELAAARKLLVANGAMRQRDAAREHGIAGLPGWLAGRWLA